MSVVGAGYMRWPPILMYHAVAQVMHDPNHICVSPKQFEAQMIYLKRRNLQGVSVQEAIHAMKAGNASRLVGLTFDDGYENFLQAALPVLKRLGFTATVFVIVGVLKEESSVDWKPRMRFLDVDGIREVTKRGMEIGSHSMSHTSL